MNYKVGDKVLVKKGLKARTYNGLSCVPEMTAMGGTVLTITGRSTRTGGTM